MMRPSTTTLLIGHPVVALPSVLATAVTGWAVFASGQQLAILVAPLLCWWILSCASTAARYRAWKREWDGLDSDAKPKRPVRKALKFIAAVPLGLAILWLVVEFPDATSPAHVIAPIALVGSFAIHVIRVLLRHRKDRRPSSKVWFVTQAITRSPPAPSVADAYARLPEYCRPLLVLEPARKEQS